MASPMPEVANLVDRAVKGILDIPEFQRGFVWSPEKVKNFVESLWREYPVGLILLWSYPEYFSPRTAKGSQTPKLWIVDGQQRLTALCLVFNRKPYWWKDIDEWNRKIEKYDVLFNILSDINRIEFGLPNPIRKKEPKWVSVREVVTRKKEQDLQLLAKEIMQRLGEDLNNFEAFSNIIAKLMSVWKVKDTNIDIRDISKHEVEDVAEIFTRLNMAGVKVKIADTYLALISAHQEGWVRDEFIPFSDEKEELGFDLEPGVYIRTISGIAEGKANLKETSKKLWTSEEFFQYWQRTKEAINNIIKRLMDKGVLSSDMLPSRNSLIPLFVLYDKYGKSGFDFANAFYWFLLANWDGRYSGSAITTLTEDIKKIRESFKFRDCVKSLLESLDVSRNVEPDDFKNEYQKERFLRLLTYLTAFNRGAKDWLSGTKIGYDKLPGFKPHWHHFFPKGKRVLKGAGFKDEEANALANITVLNEKTNRIISSNPPIKYIGRLEIPPDRLKQQFVPLDQELWKVEKYKEFLEERAKLLSDGCNSFLESLTTGLA